MRLIDADNKPKDIEIDIGKIGYKNAPQKLVLGLFSIIDQAIEQYETVNAQVVTRCKDCKYSVPDETLKENYKCEKIDMRVFYGEHFCSYGKHEDEKKH